VASGIDPELQRRVRAGEYAVDPHAVADAIVRRAAERAGTRRLSPVLVARELDGLAAPVEQPDAGAGRD
jgi:hypothetical protein